MSTPEDLDKGLCILSFDSGGSGTYSQLLLVKEYMRYIGRDLKVNEVELYPADYFDLMGGVGFGGLAAFMLGHLKMTIDQAIDALLNMASVVFPDGSDGGSNPESNMKILREFLEDMLETHNIQADTKMYNKSMSRGGCKVALYAATSADITQPRVFRTYHHRGASLNPTVVQALCATIAVPTLFSSVKIGPHRREEAFVGGPLGANNPTRELLKEAGGLFGSDKRLAQIISLGARGSMNLSLASAETMEMAGLLLDSLATDCETVAGELSTRLFHIDAYTRLNAENLMADIRMNDWSDIIAVEMATRSYLDTPEVTRLLEDLASRSRDRIGVATFGQINYSTATNISVKMAPAVSPFYIVRKEPWNTIVHYLVELSSTGQKVFTITGMGGCGKTQLVSYFLQEYGSQFTHAIFVDASSSSSLKADLQAWVQSLGAGHEQDVWELALQVLMNDDYQGKWIIVYDNADDPGLNLSPFIPKCDNGTIIITSRNRDVGNLSTSYHLELGEMETNEALLTLVQAARRTLPLAPDEASSAHKLIKLLGYLAVALVQAGTYCHQLSLTSQGDIRQFSFGQYIRLFSSQRIELMKKPESSSLDGYQLGAYTTFDLSYKAVPHSTREFLHFVSSFHYSNISLSMFATAAVYEFGDPFPLVPRVKDHHIVISDLRRLLCVDGEWNEVQTHRAIRTLRLFSLLSASSVSNTILIHLHPLVHAWARDVFPTFPHYRRMGIQVLTSCATESDTGMFKYLLPHFHNLLQENPIDDLQVNDQMGAAVVLEDRGYFRQAEEIFSNLIDTLNNKNGEDCYEGIVVAGWLAITYEAQGKLVDAEKLKRGLLEKQRRLLGDNHPHTIQTLSNLATTLDHQGRWDDAAQIKWKVLESRTKLLGGEHPSTITAIADLGETCARLQRWKERELFALEVLRLRRQVLGNDHVDTIRAGVDLASAYFMVGKATEAEAICAEMLERHIVVLGEDHPSTILARSHLGTAFSFQARWKEAEDVEREVLGQRRRVLGEEHVDTIYSMGNLARHISDQGRWREAETLEVEVLRIRIKTLGKEHPDTIMAFANLARTLAEQGHLYEAEKFELQVLGQRQRLFPKDHPHTIRAAANLAITYRQQGRLEEAEALELQVLAQREQFLGEEHLDTLRAAADLVMIYRLQGRLNEAEALGSKVLEQERRVLGARHPNTISVEANLGLIYMAQERWRDAYYILSHAVELSIEVLGQQHPYTQTRIRDMINVLNTVGTQKEIEKLGSMLL